MTVGAGLSSTDYYVSNNSFQKTSLFKSFHCYYYKFLDLNSSLLSIAWRMPMVILFTIFLLVIQTHAQNSSYREFTTENGLSSNEVYKIIEDRNGYIWMGTDRGVVKYDGYDFQIYTTEDGLSNNVVFWLYEDYKGRIWFTCTDNSVCYYENGKFITHPASKYLNKQTTRLINSIFVDERDVVWLGVSGENPFFKLHPSGRLEKVKLNQESNRRGVVILKVNEENVLWGELILDKDSANKISVFNEKFDLIYKRDLPSSERVLSVVKYNDKIIFSQENYIYEFGDSLERQQFFPKREHTASLLVDNDFLWAGTKTSGIYQSKLTDFNQIQNFFLKDYSVTSVCKDRENGYWFSTTEAGVFYCPSLHIKKLKDFNKKTINIVHTDSAIWIASSDGRIYKIEGQTIIPTIHEVYVEDYMKIKLFPDAYGQVWMNGIDNVVQETKIFQDVDTSVHFKEMVQQADSNFWFLSSGGMLKREKLNFEKLDFIRFPANIQQVTTIKTVRNNELIIGSFSGLWLMKDGVIKRHPKHQEILTNRINDLEILENGDFVISTMGEGILMLKSNGEIWRVNQKSGILSSLINCTYLNKGDSILWVGSSQGLSRIKWEGASKEKFEILNLTVFNGLKSNDVLCIDYHENKLWVGTSKGITIIDPNKLKNNKEKPLIHLQSVVLNSVEQTLTKEQYVVSGDDFIKINFDGISMNSNGNLKYRYRMIGLYDNWETVENRFLEFKFGTPGTYELEIMAVNVNGVVSSNNIRQIFIVEPPFWQTWKFRISLILFIILIVWLFFSRRFKIKQRENYLLTKSLETEQEALSLQITPHFLFNALNSIQNLFQQKKSENAVLHLANFALLMRRILHNVKLRSVFLSNEIKTLELYLDLEVLRFNDQFEYQINYGPEVNVDFIRIPPMMIQPFIENSIWHGILNKPNQKGKVTINVNITFNYLVIEVEDDGVGRAKAALAKKNVFPYKKSTGLKSIKRRMEVLNEMYNTALSFDIIDLINKEKQVIGTKVIINIPLNYA